MDIFEKLLEEEIPILLVDDEQDHRKAIKEKFLGSKYIIEDYKDDQHFQKFTLEYVVSQQHCQIAIIDLVLDEFSTEDVRYGGIKIIKDHIWPNDPKMFFIIFSQWEDRLVSSLNDGKDLNLPALISTSYLSVFPHFVFVKKEFKDSGGKELNQECLDKLFNVVKGFYEISTPNLMTQRYDKLKFLDKFPWKGNKSNIISDHIKGSIENLNDFIELTSSFVKVGRKSSRIGIGIYGSCGRMEMRENSDIECSIFCLNEKDVKLSVNFWNRMMLYVTQVKKMQFEGIKLIENNQKKILFEDDIPREFQSDYMPIIDIERLLKVDRQDKPSIMDRHYQIFTELRSVFNDDIFFYLKKNLLINNLLRKEFEDVAMIIEKEYLHRISSQYLHDTILLTKDEGKKSLWEKTKAICYRTCHILATQLCLIGLLYENNKFDKEKDNVLTTWHEFFESLSNPTALKLLVFENTIKKYQLYNDNQHKNAMDDCLHWMQDSYGRLLKMLGKKEGEIDIDKQEIEIETNSFINNYINLFQLLKEYPDFRLKFKRNSLLGLINEIKSYQGKLPF